MTGRQGARSGFPTFLSGTGPTVFALYYQGGSFRRGLLGHELVRVNPIRPERLEQTPPDVLAGRGELFCGGATNRARQSQLHTQRYSVRVAVAPSVKQIASVSCCHRTAPVLNLRIPIR